MCEVLQFALKLICGVVALASSGASIHIQRGGGKRASLSIDPIKTFVSIIQHFGMWYVYNDCGNKK